MAGKEAAGKGNVFQRTRGQVGGPIRVPTARPRVAQVGRGGMQVGAGVFRAAGAEGIDIRSDCFGEGGGSRGVIPAVQRGSGRMGSWGIGKDGGGGTAVISNLGRVSASRWAGVVGGGGGGGAQGTVVVRGRGGTRGVLVSDHNGVNHDFMYNHNYNGDGVRGRHDGGAYKGNGGRDGGISGGGRRGDYVIGENIGGRGMGGGHGGDRRVLLGRNHGGTHRGTLNLSRSSYTERDGVGEVAKERRFVRGEGNRLIIDTAIDSMVEGGQFLLMRRKSLKERWRRIFMMVLWRSMRGRMMTYWRRWRRRPFVSANQFVDVWWLMMRRR